MHTDAHGWGIVTDKDMSQRPQITQIAQINIDGLAKCP